MNFLKLEMSSASLSMNTTVNILLPSGFTDSDPVENGIKKYRVLYLLHGYYGSCEDWMRYSLIEKYADEYRLAIVMPSAYNSYYADMAYGPNVYTFISKELPLYLESILPLAKSRENRFIGGLSMGGYGALKIGLNYPDKFSSIVSLSGALDLKYTMSLVDTPDRKKQATAIFGNSVAKENDLFEITKDAKKQPLPRIYLACGTSDFLYQTNVLYHNFLKDLQIDHEFVLNDGDHNWFYWNDNIKLALKWLFKKEI